MYRTDNEPSPVYAEAIEWISEAEMFIAANSHREDIQTYQKELNKIIEFMRDYGEYLTDAQEERIKQQPWFSCQSLEEFVANPNKRRKTRDCIHYCPHCSNEMINCNDSYKCTNCSMVTVGFEKLNPSSMNSKTHYERAMDDFPEWIKCIYGRASLHESVEAVYDSLEKEIIETIVEKIPSAKLHSMPYEKKRKVCQTAAAARKFSVRDYASDEEVRRIFRKHGLAQHYKYCNTVLFRAINYTPRPDIDTSDLSFIESAYSHVMQKFDEMRKQSEIKNNRFAPAVIKCIVSTLGMGAKYKEFIEVIPQKNHKTEESLFNLVVKALSNFNPSAD